MDDNNGNDPIVIVRLLEFELEFDSHTDREGKEFDKMKVEARKKLANRQCMNCKSGFQNMKGDANWMRRREIA